MTSAIGTENLSKSFRHTAVIDGLNPDVPEGSIYGLVGVNGAGKTTAIEVLMNILLFPDYRDMAMNGMPLRSIFVALAKAGRIAS